jgi:hypothetical protein
MNDAFVTEQAGHLARRVMGAAAGAKDSYVRLAFRYVLARTPSAAEEEVCARLLRDQAALFAAARVSAADAEERALAQLCHVLFNTSEFLYAE